ncbi:hypothetical protein BJ878DRAFT_297210 [Calycina marina]|uniref:Uncharacterized protein n=1 Tax=Calycina marina TaxID=1763456 RepID=A0A9P7Z6R1_9HELO|nr:hypothetical protein BJ878DRAFT_297210 [Calycina marina]
METMIQQKMRWLQTHLVVSSQLLSKARSSPYSAAKLFLTLKSHCITQSNLVYYQTTNARWQSIQIWEALCMGLLLLAMVHPKKQLHEDVLELKISRKSMILLMTFGTYVLFLSSTRLYCPCKLKRLEIRLGSTQMSTH